MTLKIIEVIENTSLGPVYKAQDEKGEFFAVKIVPSNKLDYVELDILTRIKSPYIIRTFNNQFLKVGNSQGYGIMLREKNLADIDINKISYHQFKRIVISLLYGLDCMHKNGFLHFNISLSNILYYFDKSADINVYISDFGKSVRCTSAYNGIYIDKGKEKDQHYNDKDDVYCLGVVFIQLLGSKITIENCKDVKEEINEKYIEELIRAYNKNKTSKKEEILLKELLVHMLKLDSDERIGSDEFDRLKFYQNNELENYCTLNRPSELVVINYISPGVRRGVKILHKYYQENSSDKKLEEYFLTFQNFLQLMSKAKTFINDNETDYLVKAALNTTDNYYKKTTGGDYEIAQRLKGQMGYNYYYYASYIEDLVILNYYLISNYDNILASFNTINICEIFRVFRKVYDYKYINKYSIKLEDFFKIPVPTKKIDTDIKVLEPYEYYNKTEDEEKPESTISQYTQVEYKFRNEIIDLLRLELYNQYETKGEIILETIEKVDSPNKIQNYLKLQKEHISLAERFIDINNNLKYGIIKIDNNKIKLQTGQEEEFVIVLNKNVSSLLHIEKDKKKITHYYSGKIQLIDKLYKEFGYQYVCDYQYGVSNCCKILEACIIFIIYYNLSTNSFDFNTKCLDKNTLYVMMLFLVL